ncbi:MAG: SusC/RagA family TonB-linked outer membrane protein, partial [Bacteroidales bacterium]|nr:SusC/RagA family TonB-linked outer membrane protein [Bacteroidales bacterium]
MLRKGLLFLLMVVIGGELLAQLNVTGTVTDTYSDPVPGASVVIQGTTTGTITNIDGDYALSVAANDVLVFSFIGMSTQVVPVDGRSQINVIMQSTRLDLDEVVVVGYGVQKKKLNTGATIQVKGEELEKMNAVSPFSALQGKTPGVSIVQKSGKPGEGFKVTVRGLGTVGDASPLYIVDGVQTGIENVNPSDIESIDVLKDAASAAIYGARGANGVIIVTTKTGKSGQSSISYDGYYGVQNLYKTLDFLNAQEFMAIQDIASLNSSGSRVNWAARGVDRNSSDPGTRWIDEAKNENAMTQSHTLSMSGGTDAGNYASSLSYSNQEGIIGVGNGQSEYERISFRLNSEHHLIKDVLTFGQHLNLLRTNTSGVETGGLYNNNIRGLYTTHPLMPNKDEDGAYVTSHSFNREVGNPVAAMDIKNQNAYQNNKVVGDVYFNISPVKNLNIRSMFAVDFYSNNGRAYTPNYGYFTSSDNVDFDKIKMEASHGTTWTFDNTATYQFALDAHSFTTMIGTSVQSYFGERMSSEKQDLIFSGFDFAYPSTSSTVVDATKVEGKAEDEVKTSSFFGRVSYDYSEKYMATVTVRRDGSSKFGPNNRWGTFPSLSVGWVLTNEAFVPQTATLDFLKLRASWGQNGNDKIDAFRYLATINSQFYYPFGADDANRAVVSVPGRGANPDLKWETSEQINIGVDARMFNSNLFATVDLYQKKTNDWLVQAPILDIKGTTAPYINGGDVINTGLELALNWNDNFGEVNYSFGVNGAFNKNEVQNIPNEEGVIKGDDNVLWQGLTEIYRAQEGFPIGYFWGYETDGIFKSQAEVLAHTNSAGVIIQPRAQPGDVKFIDRNDDGSLNDADKTEIGNPHPDFTFGINLSIDYK